jgi:antitoxin component YwqK of YwqJK toxin-antitoxin module
MKKLIFCLMILNINFLSAAKKQPYVLSETYQGKYIGDLSKEEWDKRGSNGWIISKLSDGTEVRTSYIQGKIHGSTIYTYPNSTNPKLTQIFDMGRLTAQIEHFSSGEKEKETQFLQDSKKISKWYFDQTPLCIEEWKGSYLKEAVTYFNGKEESHVHEGNGILTVRDPYGILISKDTYASGELAQKQYFYPNLELKQQVPFVQGQIHGHLKNFLSGGLPLSIEEWKMGKQDGITIYFENGSIKQTVTFSDGKKHGPEKHFLENMKIGQQLNWKKGKRHGPQVTYIQGQPHEEWYLEDKCVNKFTYNLLNIPSINKKSSKA